MNKNVKRVLAVGAATVYILLPGYRYYVIGSWVGIKIMRDKPRRPTTIRKGSKLYKRIVGDIS